MAEGKKRAKGKRSPKPPRRNLLRDRHGRYVAIDADLLVAAASKATKAKWPAPDRNKQLPAAQATTKPATEPATEPATKPATKPRRRRRRPRPARPDVPTKIIRDRYGRYVSVPADPTPIPSPAPQPQPAVQAPAAAAPTRPRRRRPRTTTTRRRRRAREDSDGDSTSDSEGYDDDNDDDQDQDQDQYPTDDGSGYADGADYYTNSATVTEDYGDSSHASRFWPTMAAMVSILLALGAAGLNFLWFDRILARHPQNPLVPFYERLGQIGSTFLLATLLALFVLGSTYNLESPFAILFGVIAVVFVLVMTLSRSGEADFLASEDIYMVSLYGATIMSLVAVVASGDLTAGLLMLPLLALLGAATLEYNGVVDFSKRT